MIDLDVVCITGGAGFIGSHIADAFNGSNLKIYDNFSSGTTKNLPDETNVIKRDIREAKHLRETVADADIVFHQAAQVSVQNSIKNPVESHDTNLVPILTILEAARGTDTRVVFASSAAIYGDPKYTPIDEAHSKNPNAPYGLEKLSADHYCRLYYNLYNVEVVALRYFNVYGPRQQPGDYSGVISIFLDQALNDDPITVEGDGTQTRDFVHVDDIVKANHLAATNKDALGEAFNIGTGTDITIRELAELIQDLTDTDSDIVHTDARTGDIEHSEADISKAREDLGYEPTVSLREGLEQTIEWYRTQRD